MEGGQHINESLLLLCFVITNKLLPRGTSVLEINDVVTKADGFAVCKAPKPSQTRIGPVVGLRNVTKWLSLKTDDEPAMCLLGELVKEQLNIVIAEGGPGLPSPPKPPCLQQGPWADQHHPTLSWDPQPFPLPCPS